MIPGLESVTVTPGRTPPESSVTMPPIAPTPCWAPTGSDRQIPNTTAKPRLRLPRLLIMLTPLSRIIHTWKSGLGVFAQKTVGAGRRGRTITAAQASDPSRVFRPAEDGFRSECAESSVTLMNNPGYHSSFHRRGRESLEHELLDSSPVFDFRRVEVAFRIGSHVVKDVELPGRDSRPSERVECSDWGQA